MVVYYRGPTAKITDRVIETWCPDYQCFAIAELWEVRVGRTGPGPIDMRSTGVAIGLLAAGAVSLACLPISGGFVVMGALAGGAGVAGINAVRLRRVNYLIVARRQGRDTWLYQSTDERVFGQVRRALARALEAYDDR